MGEKQGYTPAGDWFFERRGCRVYRREMHHGRHIKVADINVTHLDEDGLNRVGNMVAAAPDLLAVAIKSHRPYVGLDEKDIRCLYGADEADLAMALRDAISRATGEDSPANEGEGAQ